MLKDKYLSKVYYISCYTKNNKLICMEFTKDFNMCYVINILKGEHATKIRKFERQDKYLKYLKKESIKRYERF